MTLLAVMWRFSALKPYLLGTSASANTPTASTATITVTTIKFAETAMAMKTLDESDVGIFCYISNLPGFRGILKQRS